MRRMTMSHKYDRSLESLKNESTRRRWELFHRAIASAKRSNTQAMEQAEKAREAALAEAANDDKAEQRSGPPLSIAR